MAGLTAPSDSTSVFPTLFRPYRERPGGGLMLVGAIVEQLIGASAERLPLEAVAPPLYAAAKSRRERNIPA